MTEASFLWIEYLLTAITFGCGFFAAYFFHTEKEAVPALAFTVLGVAIMFTVTFGLKG